MIPARITVITLGARDLDKLREFYKGLGWNAAVELDDFAAFETSGAVLALYPLDELVADAKTEEAAPKSGMRGFSLAINVERREQVDDAIDAARESGARITKEPVDAEWGGRSAYFADPEDNHWEVAWVPQDSNVAELIRRATGPAD